MSGITPQLPVHVYKRLLQWRRVGQRGQLCPGAGLRVRKIGDQKRIFKLFRNNSQRLSLVRLGHRHSINQSTIRLQLTKTSFLYSCHLLHTFIPDIYIAPLQETYSTQKKSTTLKLVPPIRLTRYSLQSRYRNR